VPRIWSDSIEAHRRDVADAVLDATARLAAEHGPLSLTMSQVAEAAGIGRATIYKYFPSLDAVLAAWHRREVAGHLEALRAVRDRHAGKTDALEAILAAYGRIVRESRPARAPALHADEHVARARGHLLALVAEVLEEGAAAGAVRQDAAASELAAFCLHAMTAAAELPSAAAVARVLRLTLDAVRR
jgi:AcrR family transcriptional regulator